MSIWIIFKLLGSLALLMFGMKSMSEALQKMAGPQLRHVLGAMTTNRFTGMLTGMLVTASVQSSTATTVMTVSFVNAGLLTLAQAISVIMGANIGTTLTAWIMSAGMSFDITSAVYPAFFLGIILIYQKRYRYIGDFLFGLSFLLMGLGTLRMTGTEMHLGENQALLDFFASFDPDSFFTTLIFLFLGGVLTFCVQSSAAVMAITMILCSSGALPIYQGIALVMGENIGTTITSNLAALSANTQARRAALAHMFFNVFGVVWILFVFRPFIDAVCGMVGYDVNMTKDAVTTSVFLANAAKLSFVLAAFHTCFNVANTFILIWFIPQIERFVCWVIKPKKVDEEEDFRLHFITAGFMKTPELSVLEAQKEIQSFSDRMQRMFNMVRELLTLSSSSSNKKDNRDSEFNKLYTRIEKYEGISDNMEIEIANYLNSVSDAHLSDDSKAKIRAMLREISELESIGDACFNMARTISRKYNGKQDHFNEKQYDHIHQMMELTDQSLSQMNRLMMGRKESFDVNRTFNIEHEINNFRDQLKSQNINDVNNREYTYAVGTIYMDLINECEKLGDYVVNVVEARMGLR
ncbi:MAG: Na/Pi cotransporter family protein [Prevotella sp.]|jgi:phosphate:Na+ symporter|uniref:Phosphate:Na+ symporter n=1 Tax=Xylanibacter ruminicola TaxID=839 RepID=A0A1H3YAN7_XYLRU|nr:Na/Pi cotransporter family protein [Xylanibacter ruminicola]MBQ3314127.1 Na/Pi cotransporter family protein [Prevotella sp.]MBQ4413672.1 Na/Pi cotransporter family protein [Prevotella sp.]MBQ6055695.1 Na/Pi cotransporter family protein [Prevotella sp.]MBR0389916.1 Na/Pi cotransporter family protein [Prevotella sp.]SEA08610.1 phosphate:Na+ symporter [Xylanibacter ruminicola]